MDSIIDFIGDGLSEIGTTAGNTCNYVARTIFRTGINIFNGFCGNAYSLFTTSPKDFAGDDAWGIVEAANLVFISIAATLVMVFWLIGFVYETIDARESMRFEQILFMYIKIMLAEFFVIHAFDIVNLLFSGAIELAGAIFGNASSLSIDYSETFYPYLLKFNPDAGCTGMSCLGYNICLILVGVLFSCVALFSAAGILLHAVKRFMKILAMIPYGTLASSTLAGGHNMRHTAEGFYRYAIATALEVVTMLMIIAVGVQLLTMDTTFGVVSPDKLSGSTGDMFVATVYAIAVKGFLITCISSGIKLAEQITQRVIG